MRSSQSGWAETCILRLPTRTACPVICYTAHLTLCLGMVAWSDSTYVVYVAVCTTYVLYCMYVNVCSTWFGLGSRFDTRALVYICTCTVSSSVLRRELFPIHPLASWIFATVPMSAHPACNCSAPTSQTTIRRSPISNNILAVFLPEVHPFMESAKRRAIPSRWDSYCNVA